MYSEIGYELGVIMQEVSGPAMAFTRSTFHGMRSAMPFSNDYGDEKKNMNSVITRPMDISPARMMVYRRINRLAFL